MKGLIERDKQTIRMMIELYAKHHPGFDGDELAEELPLHKTYNN